MMFTVDSIKKSTSAKGEKTTVKLKCHESDATLTVSGEELDDIAMTLKDDVAIGGMFEVEVKA